MEGMVFNIQRYSTEDGPGIRTTVFMKGCPLSCPWCQNPEGLEKEPNLVWYETKCIGALKCVENCPEDALELSKSGMQIDREKCTKCGECVEICPSGAFELAGEKYLVSELIDEVLKDKIFYEESGGGVTFGGGEPMLQIEFLEEIVPRLKEEGINIAIDTSGAVPWSDYEKIIEYVDLFLYDLKTLDKQKFKKVTGGNIDLVKENIRKISSHDVSIWVRTPIIPSYTGREDNIREISKFIKELQNIERYDLLAFNNLCKSDYERLDQEWELKNTSLVKEEKMEGLQKVAKKEGVKNVNWSGSTQIEGDENSDG